MSLTRMQDFQRKQAERRANARKLLNGSFTTQEGVIVTHTTKTPYKPSPELGHLFRTIAKPECFKCHGLGVVKWRELGMKYDACRCVVLRIPAALQILEEEEQKIRDQIEAAQQAASTQVTETP